MNTELARATADALAAAHIDDSVRAIVLTGAGRALLCRR